MKIGAIIPNAGAEPGQLGVTTMARAAEEAGAEGLWISDHLVFLDRANSDYPFSEDGSPSWDMTADYYEAFACCAAIAAVTTRARVGTAVLVLPQRNPFEVAKAAATIDRLSGGRLDLGVGAGWNRDEFDTLGYDFEARGARFNEMLAFLRDAWRGRPAESHGDHVKVPADVVLEPAPQQDGGVPLLVGGLSPPARRRAARFGDGWLSIAFADRWDGETMAAAIADVQRRRREESERSMRTVLKFHAAPEQVERSLDLLGEVAAAGFEEVIVEPPWSQGVDRACEVIEDAMRRGEELAAAQG